MNLKPMSSNLRAREKHGILPRKESGSFWLLGLVLFAFMLLIGFSAAYYVQSQAESARKTAMEELTAIANLKAGQITNWFLECSSDVEVFFRTPILVGQARECLQEAPPLQTKEEMQKWMALILKVYHFERITLYNTKGLLALTQPTSIEAEKCSPKEESIRAALFSKECLKEDLHLLPGSGPLESRIRLNFWIPIGPPPEAGKPAEGAVLVQLNPCEFLYPLIHSWPTRSATAETLLLRKEGDEIVYLNELRHRKNSALTFRRPITPDLAQIAASILKGKIYAGESKDYRNEPVLSVAHAVEGTPWVLVAKIDRKEVYAPLCDWAISLGALVGAFMLTIFLGASALWRLRNIRGLERQLKAELALQESERRFRMLIEQAPVAFGISRMGQAVYSNKKFLELFGFQSMDELVGRPICEMWAPESREMIKDYVARRTRGEPTPTEYEGVGQRRDGSKFSMHVSVGAVELPDGPATLAILLDITQRKCAEEALQSSRNMLAQILDSVPQSVFWKDRDSVYLGCNKVFATAAGVSDPQTVVGKTDFDFPWAGHEAEAYRAADREVMETRQPKRHIIEPQHPPNGTCIWVDTTKVLLTDGNGQVYGVLGIFEDITERLQTEEANRNWMVAIDQSAESIVFNDINGTILYVNQGFEKVTGYTRQAVLGQNIRMLGNGDLRGAYNREMRETLARGEVWHGRLSSQRKDGTVFDEEATISPVRDKHGKIVSHVAVKRDITRELQLERQVIQAQKMEAVGLLAGGLAHDYNNILAANMMLLSLLFDDPLLTPSLREGLESLQVGEERAAALTRQLLVFSRNQPMQIKTLELNALVREEFKMLRRLLGEHIDLNLFSQDDPAWVEADAGMIEQVIMNLCINARDAMPKGGCLTVSIRIVEQNESQAAGCHSKPGRVFACLSVADTGFGMSEEMQQRIFEPFYTTKEAGKGTGLGLATVYGIVKQHCGWIEVTSQPGIGSEFRVYLPASAGAGGETASAPDGSDLMVGGSETILLVEDDPNVQKFLSLCLKTNGYRVLEATHGQDALQQWSEVAAHLDLLLTDMIMPGGMTGVELAEAFQKFKPDLPVIIFSGYSQDIAEARIPNRPDYSYIAKPCGVTALTIAVRKALDDARQRRSQG